MSIDCARSRQLAPEVALGIAEGDERAAVLDHVAECQRCRQDLDELAAAADRVLLLGPETEPPAGFETRVLDRLPTVRGQSAGRRRRLALVAAAVLVLAAGITLGVLRSRPDADSTAGRRPATAIDADGILRAPGGPAQGRVLLQRGDEDRLVVELEAGAPAGTYAVHCDYGAGRSYLAGSLVVEPGRATRWAATVPVPTYDLLRVRLVNAAGGPNLEADMGA